jgi:ParB family chromosome partitioning protein
MKIQSIPLDQIKIADRIRATDDDYVKLLALSIDDRGLIQPITVGEKCSDGLYPLQSGMHRVEAFKLLGISKIAAIVAPVKDDLENKLIEIDENLMRHELTALDRGEFLKQRQEIYELLYPDTKAGVAGGLAKNGVQRTNLSFAENAAERLGVSERSIRRSIQRAKHLSQEVKDLVSGTKLANNGSELDALAGLEPTEQSAVIDILLSDEPKAKSVSKAIPIIRGEDLETEEVDPVVKATEDLKLKFARAPEEAQSAFIEYLKELELI